MSWVAVAIGGSAVVGAVVSNESSRRASDAQTSAANAANSVELQMFNQQRADLEPWRNAGTAALAGMQDPEFQRDFTAADFTADPGYDFRMKEGAKALENSASARGGSHGSATQKAMMNYGQGLASSEYQNAYDRFNANADRRFNRLASVAGTGQTAVSQTGQASANYANQVSSNLMGAGNAQGAAAIAQGNQYTNLIGQGLTAGAIYNSGVKYSDERLKKNISAVSKEDLDEMKKHLKAYAFDYINPRYGEGRHIGVMAQDLEKSKLGATLVFEDPEGNKQIDMGRVMMLFLATMAEG